MDLEQIQVFEARGTWLFECAFSSDYVGDDFYSLFCRTEFVKLHKDRCRSLVCYRLRNVSSNKVVLLHWVGEVAGGIWRSPVRGSYGGVESSLKCGAEEYDYFYSKVLADLKSRGCQSVEVILKPAAYAWEAVNIEMLACLNAGFHVRYVEGNYAIKVGEADYMTLITQKNRKKIRKVIREGWEVRDCNTLSGLRAAFEVIRLNRESKAFPLTMSLEQFEDMWRLFEDRFHIVGLFDKEKVIAAAICLHVEYDVLYVFMWGDLPGYSGFSPVVSLSGRLYQYCFDREIGCLDLGTSTVDGRWNHGLARFKQGLGAECTHKYRLSYGVDN